jgi:histidine triad (HIT) family protein
MSDCVFCNIAHKVLEKDLMYEDDEIMVFQDILPKAPVHVLIVTKEHIVSIAHVEERHQAMLGKMIIVAKQMGEKLAVDQSGYKLVYNVGKDGGQVIPHLHMHLLGGKSLGE